jgi:nucleotide-binding universal stress UspA family protein
MTARSTGRPPAGDWLVVPLPPVERGWRWGRIVEQLPGPGPARFRVRWVGNDRDSVVVAPEGYRIESAAHRPEPPSSAIGLWPHPDGQEPGERGAGLVVVGVDGSPGSCAALDFALRDAARRGARLRVVAAVAPPEFWATPYGPVPVPPSPALLDEIVASARGWVDEAAARLGMSVPADVAVEVLAASGPPAHALLDAARDADHLVVGHRGRGAVASALLGSVGLRCVLHAHCPVTVVRPVPAPAPRLDPVTAMAVPAPVPVPVSGV